MPKRRDPSVDVKEKVIYVRRLSIEPLHSHRGVPVVFNDLT